MSANGISRRVFLVSSAAGAAAVTGTGGVAAQEQAGVEKKSSQRLSIEKLHAWEKLQYGMFIHYGMSTFVQNELPDGQAPASTYAPDKLDVAQWVSVARDAGMQYAVLTTKHVAGHCLWATKHTDYSVVNSGDKTDVVEKFVTACRDKGVLPGFYYCSWDNHNRFGSKTPSDKQGVYNVPYTHRKKRKSKGKTPEEDRVNLPAFTTSLYQAFQTAQLTELLTQFGPIAETWIDIPGVLGRGYRTFLYNYIAQLQPETVIMMNSGISDQTNYNVDYSWPSDIIAIERSLPVESGFNKWREIEGKTYYMPGEVCDPIGKDWFWVEGDVPRKDASLATQFEACRARGVNLLLDVPPDKHGLMPEYWIKALNQLRKNVNL
jgi:alpha-L-fucosidase